MKANAKVIKHIAARVRMSGNRFTRARERIAEVLADADEPLSVQAVVGRVDVDEASVYRTILLFKSLELIEELVHIDGSRRFALHEGHHDHIVCEQCGHVAHIPCPHGELTLNSKVNAQFTQIHSHAITYYGVCVKCAR